MVNYTRLAATAKRLIEANGRSVTFRMRDRTAANVAQPWRGPDNIPTPPDGEVVTAVGVFVPAEGSGLGRQRVVDGTLLDTSEQVCIVAATSLPSGTDLGQFSTVEDTGRAWKIDYVDTLAPGATTLIYVLGVSS